VDAPTAKAESSLSTCGLSQLLHMTSVTEAAWIFSNFAPHSRHRYSKMGIAILRFEYTGCSETLQSPVIFRRRVLGGMRRRRISAGFARDAPWKTA
jgi:hypothetical protein